MALPTAATFAADGQSTKTILFSLTLTAGADAAAVQLREGSSSGTIHFVTKAPAAGTTHIEIPCGAVSATGAWYVDFTAGTSPSATIVGEG